NITVQDFLGRIGSITPSDYRNFTSFDFNLIEDTLDTSGHQVTQTDDRFNLAVISGEVIRHSRNNLGLIKFGFGYFVGYAERLEYGVDPFGFEHLISRTGDFYRHPNEIAFFDEVMIHQILRPTMTDRDVVAADVGVTAAGLIFGVHNDHRNTGRMGIGNDLGQAARIGRAGDYPSRFRRDGGADSFLLRRNIAAMEGGANVIPGVLPPLFGTLEENGPDRVRRRPVGNPIIDCFVRSQTSDGGKKRRDH